MSFEDQHAVTRRSSLLAAGEVTTGDPQGEDPDLGAMHLILFKDSRAFRR